MSDQAVALLLGAALLWGAWYLWSSLKTGIAPEPMFDIRRDASPVLYWTFTGIFAAILALGLATLIGLCLQTT